MSNIQDVVLYDNYNGYHFLFFVIPCLVPFSEPKNKNKNSKVCFWFLFCRLIPLGFEEEKKRLFLIIQREKENHLGGGPVIRVWDQEVCFFCGLRFEPYGCSYDGHWRLTWSLTSGPVGLVEVRASWPGHPR
jgi:hypothetical protein